MAEKLILQVQQYFMEAEERAQGGDQVAGMAVAEEAVDGDQAVELEPLIPFATVHLKRELEALLQRPVDLVRLRERMNPALRQEILRDGLCA
jgi:hypothetical protein